ncbi:hypothetical protein [Hyphomicrobium sp.]|uniref:hypothetical protein n=1 Tax=Hyphomicrobium sp. TaxID=82 RepID=UPI002E34E630|nr:hypothetical protein [Hyphomicrobium sp.]HEX2842098.1 hypothetical protein [Hyphomicrobium sp.]
MCWPAVALVAFVNEAEPAERDPRQVHLLDRDIDAVDSSGVHEDRADVADVHADRGGTSALFCARLGVGDEALARQARELFASKICLELFEAERFGAEKRLTSFSELIWIANLRFFGTVVLSGVNERHERCAAVDTPIQVASRRTRCRSTGAEDTSRPSIPCEAIP